MRETVLVREEPFPTELNSNLLTFGLLSVVVSICFHSRAALPVSNFSLKQHIFLLSVLVREVSVKLTYCLAQKTAREVVACE